MARIARVVAVTAAVSLAVTALLAGAPAASADDGFTGVRAIAHRGASARAPEHTLAAVDRAVAEHADRLSIDVRLTRDGVPLVVHDEGLARTTDVEGRFPRLASWAVDDLTLAQIRTLDAGSWFGSGRYTGARMLTLAQLLTELADSEVGLVVEAKSPQTADGVDGIGDAIMAVLAGRPKWARANRDGSPRVVLESFRWPFLDRMHAAYPALPLVLLGDSVSAGDLAAHPYVVEVDVEAGALTPSLLEAAHRRGVAVGVYTVNSEAAISRTVAAGVDGVTSDRPDRVRVVLDAVDRLWSGTLWPSAPPVAGVGVSATGTASVGGRVAVRARLVDAGGRPVRWHRLRVSVQVSGRWVTVARVVTSSRGTADVSLPAQPGMRLRAASVGHWSAVATPTVRG